MYVYCIFFIFPLMTKFSFKVEISFVSRYVINLAN